MDWSYSTEVGLSGLDGISEQTQNLERAVLRENEVNKNLQEVLQKLVAEIKVAEEQSNTYREDIKATLNRQRIVENSIQSTNESCLLVDKLRCDLKKQVTLEQIKTEEQTERLEKILTKYEKLWNGYETVYNLFPMVPEKNNLKLHIRNLEIIVSQRRKLLEEEKAKKSHIEAIRARIMQLKIVNFITLILEQSTLHEKYSRLKEKIVTIQAEIGKNRKEITEIKSKLPCAKEKTVSVKQVQSVQNLGLEHVKTVPVAQSPNVTSSVHQKTIIKVPEVPKARDLTKTLLFSPLEMTHIELPQLKLPVFNSPPRKVQRISRPVVRPVRLFPEYSFQEKEDTTLECPRNEVIPMEVNREATDLVVTSEITTFEDHMEVEETQEMEQVSSTFSRTQELTPRQYQLEQKQQKQHTGQQGEQEQSQLMHQQVHEQRQEEYSVLCQDLQTSEQLQQQQQKEQEEHHHHHHQQQPLQQHSLWNQQEHQQEENDPQLCQNEAVTEHFTDMQTDDEPVGEMRSSSQPLSENSDVCDTHPLSHDESFDSTSERARREFLSKVTKSPEFTFIPRRDLNIEEVDKGDDVQIDTRSQYFLNPLQSCSEQRTVTEQARQQDITREQNVAPHVIEPEFTESTECVPESQEHAGQGISPREKETNMEATDDLLAVSFHSLSPPDAINVSLSPPSSQAPGPAGNQGFMFSFAPQSSGSIMSLFGEGEPNQEQEQSGTQQKKNEAFTFTFDKKTKSSSFFKLF